MLTHYSLRMKRTYFLAKFEFKSAPQKCDAHLKEHAVEHKDNTKSF